MNRFTIESELSWYTNPATNIRERKVFLHQSTDAFYHCDYNGGGNWKNKGTIENIIVTLKNDITPYSQAVLDNVCVQLTNILVEDLTTISQQIGKESLTICVIPRAKTNYNPNQLLFKLTVSNVADILNGFSNGVNYITRHTDTITTHRHKAGFGGNGNLPYPGITKDTCTISNEVKDKDILLIDDLYTHGINIDEDAIQSLLDNGANSVIFYSVGKTV